MVKHSPNALLWKGESETVYTFSEELTVVPSSYPFTACPDWNPPNNVFEIFKVNGLLPELIIVYANPYIVHWFISNEIDWSCCVFNNGPFCNKSMPDSFIVELVSTTLLNICLLYTSDAADEL